MSVDRLFEMRYPNDFGATACCCIGPQNGEPHCPCKMRNMVTDDLTKELYREMCRRHTEIKKENVELHRLLKERDDHIDALHKQYDY